MRKYGSYFTSFSLNVAMKCLMLALGYPQVAQRALKCPKGAPVWQKGCLKLFSIKCWFDFKQNKTKITDL